MKKIYLIDGSSFIFRAYYAIPNLKNKDGSPIGAIFGFCNMLIKFLEKNIKQLNCCSIALFFDGKGPTFRNILYSKYKNNRPPIPIDLIPQLDLIHQACKSLNIKTIISNGVEADDMIASYANNALNNGMEVIIISSDKDFFQIVQDKVFIWDPLKNFFIDLNKIKEKFDIDDPKILVDIFALVGDPVDNVPGVPGIGIKTSTKIIKQFKNIENLIKNTLLIENSKHRINIENNLETILLSKKLISLKSDIEVHIQLNQFLCKEMDLIGLEKFLIGQSFFSLLKRIRKLISDTQLINYPSKKENDYKIINTSDDLNSWIDKNLIDPLLVISCQELVDEDNKNKKNLDLYLLSKNDSCCRINFIDIARNNLKEILDILNSIFLDFRILKIVYDVKDILFKLKKYNLMLSSYEDIMIMSYVLHSGLHKHDIKELVERYINREVQDFKKFSFVEEMKNIFNLYFLFKKQIPKAKITYVYEKIERLLIPIVVEMESRGVLIDTIILKNLDLELEKKINKLEKEIWEQTGYNFNIASSKQLGVVLINKFNINKLKKTNSGNYLVDSKFLINLFMNGFDFAKLILDWRASSKIRNAYIKPLLRSIDPETKKIHTSYSLIGTITGRLSSSNPNIQNIPIKTDDGREIRKAFISKTGYKLLSLDYSQIELRLLAHVSQDENLINSFSTGEDIHRRTASLIFKVPIDMVNDSIRRIAKTVNFGIIYGMSSYGLSNQLNISKKESDNIINTYFNSYPRIKNYIDKTNDFLKNHGYVLTIFGRRCHILDYEYKKGKRNKDFQERQAINAPLQGSSADIIKKAMIDIYSLLLNESISANLILQIHDELVFEVEENILEKVSVIFKKKMEAIIKLNVPLIVDTKIGSNWCEMKNI